MSLKCLFNLYPFDIKNCNIDLASVNTSIKTLWQELNYDDDFEARVNTITHWMLRRQLRIDYQFNEINCFLFLNPKDTMTVSTLAKNLHYSSRHLNRKFIEILGMNCKQTIQFKKYLYALYLIHHTSLSLTNIAYEANFYDQSHFIKTFKSFSSLTPLEYKQQKSTIIGIV